MITLREKLLTFLEDPCDSDFQRGYLSALLQEYEDRGNFTLSDRDLSDLHKQTKGADNV